MGQWEGLEPGHQKYLGSYTGTGTEENTNEVPYKTESSYHTYDPAVPLLGTYPEKMTTLI